MTYKEMTIAEILNDPLIGKMMRADGVTVGDMEKLFEESASRIGVRDFGPGGAAVPGRVRIPRRESSR